MITNIERTIDLRITVFMQVEDPEQLTLDTPPLTPAEYADSFVEKMRQLLSFDTGEVLDEIETAIIHAFEQASGDDELGPYSLGGGIGTELLPDTKIYLVQEFGESTGYTYPELDKQTAYTSEDRALHAAVDLVVKYFEDTKSQDDDEDEDYEHMVALARSVDLRSTVATMRDVIELYNDSCDGNGYNVEVTALDLH